MSEETRTEEVINETVVTEEKETSTDNSLAASLMDSFLNDTTVKHESAAAPKVEETKVETTQTQEETEEVLDEADYLKDLGWANKEAAINEVKILREKAAKADSGFEWKNDYSKQVAEILNEGEEKEEELYNHLHTKRQIKKLATTEITDTKLAAELVKFGIQNDNKDSKLSADEVEFLFNERYAAPKEPVQRNDELNDDFEERHNEWKQQVSNIEKRMIIEAKMQQPKLSAYQNELVLPKIERENQQPATKQPSQEEVAKWEADKNSFLQSAQQSLNTFDGFKVNVKDKDVNYTVSYVPSAEEKTLVETKLQQFAQSGYDANALFFDRWVKEDGTIDQNKVVEDYIGVLTREKAQQKLTLDAVGKRMEAYIASKKRPNVNAQQQQGTFSPNAPKTEQEAIVDAFLAV